MASQEWSPDLPDLKVLSITQHSVEDTNKVSYDNSKYLEGTHQVPDAIITTLHVSAHLKLRTAQ